MDVLWDERKKVNPGAKFKDADLVGIPLRIVVGRDAGERKIEWSVRTDTATKESLDANQAMERAIRLVQESGR